MKHLLKKYNTFYNIYKKSKNYDDMKQLILKDESIDKKQVFYYHEYSEEGKFWQVHTISFSISEAKARKSLRFSIKRPLSITIKEVTLENILSNEKFYQEFCYRISDIVPFSESDIELFSQCKSLKTLWLFNCLRFDNSTDFIFFDGKKFLYSTCDSKDIKSFSYFRYEYVIDDAGKYGAIFNKTNERVFPTSKEMGILFEPKYHFLYIKCPLVAVQELAPFPTDENKKYLCKIIDIDTKKVYSEKAICYSFSCPLSLYGSFKDSFLEVENNLIRYVQIDETTKKISKSKLYYKINIPSMNLPETKSPKPNWIVVQDKKSKLYGFIDKYGKEVIETIYEEVSRFYNCLAVVKKDGKDIVIDALGNIVLEGDFACIEQYSISSETLFFVKNHKGEWALFKKDKKVVDFIDISKVKQLPPNNNFPFDDIVEITYKNVLILAYQQKKRKMYRRQYVKIFNTLSLRKELKNAGVWFCPARVTKLPKIYLAFIKKESYLIGWECMTSQKSNWL